MSSKLCTLFSMFLGLSGCHRSHEGPPLGPYDAGPPWNGEGVGVLSEWARADREADFHGAHFAVTPAGVVYLANDVEVFTITDGARRVHLTRDELAPPPGRPGGVRLRSFAVDSDGRLYLARGDGAEARIDVSSAPHEVSPLFELSEPIFSRDDEMAVLTPSELLLSGVQGLWLVSETESRRLWEWADPADDGCRSRPNLIAVRGDTVYTLAFGLARGSVGGADRRCLVRPADVTPATARGSYRLGGVAAHPAGGAVLYVAESESLYRVEDDGGGRRIETEPDLTTLGLRMATGRDVGVDGAGRIYLRTPEVIYRITPPRD